MECNKDEAAQAKELAEKKLTEKNISEAKKFALKAQNLFPGLEGLPQLMEVIEIYVAYGRKVFGEIDWYSVLRVEPSADDSTIRRQYKNLARALYPDRNKAVGADGAFKILMEAWSNLSDKDKRVAYQQKRPIGLPYQKATGGMPSIQTGVTSVHSSSGNSSNSSNVKSTEGATDLQPRPTPPLQNPDSFWTLCRKCEMHFEFSKKYRNQNLWCHNCREPFLAMEVPHPPLKADMSSKPWFVPRQQQGVNNATADVHEASGMKLSSLETSSVSGVSPTSVKIESVTLSKAEGTRSAPGPATSFTLDTSNLQKTSEYLKRQREASAKDAVSEIAVLNERNRKSKRRQVNVAEPAGNSKGMVHQMVPESERRGQGNSSRDQEGSSGGERTTVPKPKNVEECSLLKLRSMYMEKARMGILQKLDEWRSAASSKFAPKEEKGNQTAILAAEISALSATHVDLEAQGTEFVTMDVPDPDFHDFDMDRTEDSFSKNQVWAAYDDDDGMPRFYALVHGIICKKPFKVRISWLKSKTNDELGPLDWVKSGFGKTCGEFRSGKQEIHQALNSFSHMVNWTKGARGVYHIFPKKGEIWALYKNWTPEWNVLTPNEVVHKYEMVEVVEDFDEHHGVAVAPLVKVAGFKSVFFPHTVSSKTWTIAREELFRFSHQVPSYLLTGEEALSAPRGCRELDPAAMPLELLQVLQEDTVAGEVKKAENPANIERSEGEKAVAEAYADVGSNVDVNLRFKEPIVTYARKRKGKKMVGDAD